MGANKWSRRFQIWGLRGWRQDASTMVSTKCCKKRTSQDVHENQIDQDQLVRGCQNGAFGKRSFAWVTPAIFVVFVDFRGRRAKIPPFCG